jgi:hypothetical protein
MSDTTIEQQLSEIYSEIDSAIDGIKPVENDEVLVTPELEPDIKSEPKDQVPSVSTLEKDARAKGWRPKDEWQGDDDAWVDFNEFNRRTELFEKINGQHKTIKSLNKKLDALVKHNQSLETTTRDKIIAELESKRKEAVKYGDTEAFDEVEQELQKAKETKSVFDEQEHDSDVDTNLKQDDKGVEIPKPIKDFAERNTTWFEKDQEMTDFAVFKVQQFTNKGLPLSEALEKAEQEVKSAYSHKFKNPNKDKPSVVMSGAKEARPEKAGISSLTPEQKQVWHSLKGVMTPDEFMKQIEGVK